MTNFNGFSLYERESFSVSNAFSSEKKKFEIPRG